MEAMETVITVEADRTGTVRLPGNVSPGKHAAIIVIDEPVDAVRSPLDLPAHDAGPWPANLSLRREDLYGDEGR